MIIYSHSTPKDKLCDKITYVPNGLNCHVLLICVRVSTVNLVEYNLQMN